MGIVYAECEATSKYNVTGGSNAFIALSFYKGKAFLYDRKLRCNYLSYKKRSAKDAYLAEMKLVVNDIARARKSPESGLFVLKQN